MHIKTPTKESDSIKSLIFFSFSFCLFVRQSISCCVTLRSPWLTADESMPALSVDVKSVILPALAQTVDVLREAVIADQVRR